MARRGARRPHRADPPLSPGPFTEIRYPDVEPLEPDAQRAGHPTSPGLRETNVPRMGGPSPGNGQPGVPRVRPSPRGTSGIPGTFPNGPMQPGVEYEGELE